MRRFLILLIFVTFCVFTNEETPTFKIDTENLNNNPYNAAKKQSEAILRNSLNLSYNSEISTNNLIIDLKNPSFSNGVLTTNEGGVIKNADLRIQATKIQYTKRKDNGTQIHRIEAEGSLMMIYKDRVFVGDKLEYDFIENNGILYKGRTFSSPWYLSGDKIVLDKNANFKIENVSITTCESLNSAWDIFAGNVSIEERELIHANKVRFRLFSFPALWFPSFNLNLKKFFSKPIFSFKPNWDKASGPRASIRYEAYSWRDFALFLRLDYRYKMGFGGAVETEYFPVNKRTTLVTRSYLAQDMIPNDLSKKRRYRYQGVYHHQSTDNKTTAFLTWDKYSDIRMPNDFKSNDFELDTGRKTELMWRNEKTNLISILHSRVRANSFETTEQDLPTIYLNIHPLKSDKMGFISYNWAKLAYLDYSYSDDVCYLKNFYSFRAELRNELYRPIYLNGITLTPKAGFVGIYYLNSPDKDPKALTCFLYGGKIQTDLFRIYKNHKHIIEPYAEYAGLTHPNVEPDDHYIFSIHDGYHSINMLRVGVLNQIFSLKKFKGKPTFEINTYANCFFGNSKTKIFTPKGYLSLTWNLPSIFLLSESCWNIDKKIFDYSNARVGWTINENLAIALELRYRSQYDWRKADKDNYILDVTRDENQMLLSPLSDRRSTFLAHIFCRINPYWTLHFQSHHGWNRKKERGYNEFQVDLTTLLSTRWKISLSYMHTEVDDRFTFDYFLMKF